MNYDQIKEKLEKLGQVQLLRYYDELNDEEKKNLLKEIENIDFNMISLHKEAETNDEIVPMPAMTMAEINAQKQELAEIGLEKIRQCKVAAVLLAGGQGTRLGIDGPKGAFNIGITKDIYIFECLIKNLTEVCDQAGAKVPLFVMTSEKNDAQTRAFFNEHDYFGYGSENVYFFIQDMAPSTDYDGKVYLEGKGHISLSPNGNGGWYKSIKKAGLDKEMAKLGIEWINVFSVDNVLQRMADPVFVGATVKSGCPVGSKVISKVAPDEKVGVMCYRSGKPSIVEYYELTDEMANQKTEDGTLAYNWGVILNYLFKVDELEAIEKKNLPLHIVEKKIPHLDENGELVKPESPNGYKFETLVLDMIEMMDGCLAFEIDRAKEFAPIKNMHGKDSLDSAREMLQALGREL